MEGYLSAVPIRLSDEIEARLTQLATLTGRSKTFYITEAIFHHLDDFEDLFLAEQRLGDIRAERTKTMPLKEVMKRFDMAS